MSTKRKNQDQPYGLTNEVVDGFLNGATSYDEVFGEGGIYRSLTKRLFERMLERDRRLHLGYEKHQKPPEEFTLASGGNSRNGTSSKTVSSSQGDVRLDIVRDRRGTFEPKIIPKGGQNKNHLPERHRRLQTHVFDH